METVIRVMETKYSQAREIDRSSVGRREEDCEPSYKIPISVNIQMAFGVCWPIQPEYKSKNPREQWHIFPGANEVIFFSFLLPRSN